MKVGIVGKIENNEVVELTRVLVEKFIAHDIEVYLENKLADLVKYNKSAELGNIHKHSDVVIV